MKSLFSQIKRSHFMFIIGDDGIFFMSRSIKEAEESCFIRKDDEVRIKSILSLISKHPSASITLFADNLAQDFRRETLPKLNIFDRKKLIQRRLQQAFPQALLSTSLKLRGRNILLTALHDSSSLSDWLAKLKARTPTLGLIPVECADIVMRLLPDARHGWALMLSRHQTGGFRQIVTHKGELIFTRLTPPLPQEADSETLSETVARDITATIGYLSRLGLNESSALRIVVLASDHDHDALWNIKLPIHSLTVLSPFKAAKNLQLPFIPYADEPYSDKLFAGWLTQKTKLRLPLMLPDMHKAKQTHVIKQIGTRVAAVALLIALSITGYRASDVAIMLYESRAQKIALASLHDGLRDKQTTTAPVTEPLGRLRQALERQRLYSENPSLPWEALNKLEHGMGKDARLIKLNWQNESGQITDGVLQVDVGLTRTLPDDASTTRPNIIADFRNVASNIEKNMPNYDVKISRYPFPALPQDTVSNNIETGPVTAELTIRRNIP